MANIRKSFNLRNGVQVDNDNFVVNANGLVGIGTSVPTEILDVVGGNIKCNSTIISNNLNITGVASAVNLRGTVINSGITSITSGIITASSGVVTYYGDGSKLLNLPTSQWLDIDVGLGFTSIYAQGFVGIGTNDPRFLLQIGGGYSDIISAPNGFIFGVGINSTGDIVATGNVTAGNFIGDGSQIIQIDASNISLGTLDTSRLPSNVEVSGIITAGNFVGNGSLITSINASNISSGTLDNARLPSNVDVPYLNVGTSGTVTSLNSDFIGIGTLSGSEEIRIFNQSGETSIRLSSLDDKSSIILGRNVNNLSQNGVLRYGNNNSIYGGTVPQSLDIINYGSGNINYYNNIGAASSSNFNWIKGYNSFLMTLTESGRLGIGKTNPAFNLDVVGTSSITSDLYVGQNLTVQNNLSIVSGTFNSSIITGTKVGVATNLISSSYDFQVGADPTSPNGGTSIKGGNVRIKEDIQQVRNINSSGIVTGVFNGNGASITAINASNISSGTLSETVFPETITKNINSGIVTANTNFVGVGSLITNINADNITTGTLDNSILPDNITLTGNLTAEDVIVNGALNLAGDISADSVSVASTISTNDLNVSGTLLLQSTTITTGIGTFNASVGIATVIDSFAATDNDATLATVEYTIYLENSTNVQAQKLLATQRSTSAYWSGFGTSFGPNQIGIASARINSGNLQLLIIPQTGISGLTTYQFIRQILF